MPDETKLTLITRPIPHPPFLGRTGAERAAARETWFRSQMRLDPTKETRQNYRAALRKAIKLGMVKP